MDNSSIKTSSMNQEPVLGGVNSEAVYSSCDRMNNSGAQANVDAVEQAELKERLASERERCLRLAADLENFKKRTARESERCALKLKDDFIRQLLPVVDNLERALAENSATSRSALNDGVQLIFQQLLLLLRAHGFESELSLGQVFDPHRHEAMRTRTDTKFADHTVLEVWQRGWRRGSELFRPAKVVVNDLTNVPQPDQPLRSPRGSDAT